MGKYVDFVEDKYGLITLKRPEKRHAIHTQMAIELHSAVQQAKRTSIPFLVITSEGSNYFCAGGDLNTLHSGLPKSEVEEKLFFMNEVLYSIATFPVPVICLLQGNALGGGCELATACDIRIAKSDTNFGFIQTKVGILPGWGGGALLYKKQLMDLAYHWLLTGSIHDTTYLYEKGWLQEVHQDKDWNIDQLLAPYINKSIKQMVYLKAQYLRHIDKESLRKEMKQETAHCVNLWGSPSHHFYINEFKKE